MMLKLGYFFIFFPPDVVCIQPKRLLRCARSLANHLII